MNWRVDSAPPRSIDQFSLPVFQQDWWVKIARGPTDYDEAKVLEGNVVVGSLPFSFRKNRLGIMWGGDFHWSHLGGPIVSQDLSPKRQAEVLDELIAQLPRGTSYRFVCSTHVSYAPLIKGAFKKAGFRHSTQVTYLRPPGDGLAADIMRGFRHKKRSHINSADRTLEVREIAAEEFVDFYDANLKAQGVRISSFPLVVAHDLIVEGRSRGQVRVIAARKRKNESSDINIVEDGTNIRCDAAIAYAWDKERYYFWMSTRRIHTRDYPRRPHPDAIKLLAMKGMAHAQSLGLTFDADGVSTPGTEHLYKDLFGLKVQDVRDKFERTTMLAKFYEDRRVGIKRAAAFLGLK